MTAAPIATPETIARIIDADVAYTLSRMGVLERLPGNPIGIAYRKPAGHVTALMARHLPSFNRVIGLRAGDALHIAPLDAWYRDSGVAARFEMIPGHHEAALGRELARLCYYHSDFHAALICPPDIGGAGAEAARIEAVTDAAQMEDFLHAYVAGWGLPAHDHERFKANVRPWRGLPGWSLYLGHVDGRPAAAGTLFLQGNAAYLADACTDPAFRRRGLHTALLHRRIADARRAGADLVFSGAEFLSSSYRDMQRIGMQLCFLRARWSPV